MWGHKASLPMPREPKIEHCLPQKPKEGFQLLGRQRELKPREARVMGRLAGSGPQMSLAGALMFEKC